jgi:putative hydrolase of the HAD superfamily
MHKAILFDLGKVLIHFDFQRGYRALEPFCPHSAAEIPRRIAGTGLVDRFESGLVEPREFVDEMSRILDLRVDYDRFCEIWSCIFMHELLPESMLIGLAKRYRLVLLSNTNALHFEVLRRSYAHMLRHFHQLVLSYEVRAMKPKPEIFRAAVGAAQCRAEECFYTDDIAAYVEGARKLGIDAVRFESREQIEREMHARGITWE